MKRTFILTAVFLSLATTAAAAELKAGIVQGLWYSTDSVFAGVPTRIYIAVRNSTDGDLSGTVTFYDNSVKIGSQSVNALSGRIIESWIDWKPTHGQHTISAELTRLKVSAIGTSTVSGSATVASAEDTIFVDYDTDHDGLGNVADTDDDGDSIDDAVELANGTDPLTYNAPPQEHPSDESKDVTENITNATTSPSGLERFLTPSRADTILTDITTWTTDTKAKLDDFRTRRALERSGTSSPAVTVNEDGFGEITRMNEADQKRTVAEMPSGFVGDMVRVVGNIIGGIVTAVLAVTSWTLGHPTLVQLLLLLGTLFAIVGIARKLGTRPLRN